MTKIREQLISELKKELVGPRKESPYLSSGTGEEVLLQYVHGNPIQRYGASILYPKNTLVSFDFVDGDSTGAENLPEDVEEDEGKVMVENDQKKRRASSEESSFTDDPITLANNLKPSSLGVSCRIRHGFKELVLRFKGGFYTKGKGTFPQYKLNQAGQPVINEAASPSEFWERNSIIREFHLSPKNIPESKKHVELPIQIGDDNDWVSLRITNRSSNSDQESGVYFLTFSAVNNKIQKQKYPLNEECIFQATVELEGDHFCPFEVKKSRDEEIDMLHLLYREKQTFAVSHGTGVEWENTMKPTWIRTTAVPSFEVPVVEPTMEIKLSMYELSDKGNWVEALNILERLRLKYEEWIVQQEEAIESLPPQHQKAGRKNMKKCRESLKRIQNGIKLLSEGKCPEAVKAFRYMNRAMLWQQQRSKIKQRRWTRQGNRVDSLELYNIEPLEDFQLKPGKGRWRPFQLAFILQNLEALVDPDSEDRDLVELIWFPTGGGKTEAYLGVTAFTIFLKRLRNQAPEEAGTTVLMRYTLRLLTTQQFERACSLIVQCNMIVKEQISDFGWEPAPVSIGLWVGSKNTPNKNEKARQEYKDLQQKNDKTYNFIVLKCPCCGGQIGKLDEKQRTANIKIKGLHKEDDGRIYFQCENKECETFGSSLPIYVVDEMIYEKTPDIVLATVDKLALLPFKEETGRLFGFRDDNGETKRVAPPELIIQDELHLISGPLGTMVGHFETMVQTLCNDYKRDGNKFIPINSKEFIPPKILASTATISRAASQVKALYGKEKLHIFPPQGLEFGNTWFSEEVKPEEKSGRLYVGICPTGYPSAQTAIVRTYASILQKVWNLQPEFGVEQLDFYWTLVGYFNSIRELGGAVNLISADIQERIKQITRRDLHQSRRKNLFPLELTSRVDSNDIPEFLKQLEITIVEQEKTRSDEKLDNKYAKDLCLATNMIATGVDISRFGLMFVHGQPKTTAEYIQASSRVGRDSEGPGLVFTLFNPNKARDKSQFEHFQSYHSRIYASVEPTSVTPFSIITRERALKAVATGLCRHLSSSSLRERASYQNTDFAEITDFVKNVILERVGLISPEEQSETENQLESFFSEWKERNYSEYGDAGNSGINRRDIIPLLYSNAQPVNDLEKQSKSHNAPSSMRGVDSESKIKII